MAVVIKARWKMRSGTTAEWAANDEVLGDGEVGEEVTADGRRLRKVGNGADAFSVLPYYDNDRVDQSISPTDGQVRAYDAASGLLKWSDPAGGSPGNAVTLLSISSGVVGIDCSLGDYFELALDANVTSITFSNLPASGKGKSIMIRVQQDATGAWTVALPTSFKATNGSDTTVQAAANAYTVIAATTFDQGTRWEYVMKACG